MPSAYSIPSIYEKEIKAVITAGYYSNKSEVVRDALRSLFESKAQLRMAAAVELYKEGEVTLSKGAELAGITTVEFKDVLKDRGIKIIVPEKGKKELEKQVRKIGKIRSKR